MKIFKSPVTVVLTLLAIVPMFAVSLLCGSTLLLPAAALAALFYVHIVHGRPSESDGAKDEALERMEKDAVKAAANLPIMASNRGGSYNYIARLTYVQKHKGYHGGFLCWLIVFVAYLAMSIAATDKIFGYMAVVKKEYFLSFFLGTAALALADFIIYILGQKKRRLATVLAALLAICGGAFFISGIIGLPI